MEKRFYSFRLISYASEMEIQELLKYCSKWEYIWHDKDLKDDGTPKEPHWHINVVLKQWKTVTGVCKLIKSEANTLAIPMIDKVEAHEYLTHKNNPEKYQYDSSLIKHSGKQLVNEGEDKEQINEEWLTTLINARTLREKAIKLGKDYIRYRKQYEEFIDDLIMEEADMELGINRNVKAMDYDEVMNELNWHLEEYNAWISSEEYKKLVFEEYFNK